MFDVNILDSIDAGFLRQAVAQKIPESLTLDFKGGHYDMNDAGKRAFLEDVSSFANTAGGFW